MADGGFFLSNSLTGLFFFNLYEKLYLISNILATKNQKNLPKSNFIEKVGEVWDNFPQESINILVLSFKLSSCEKELTISQISISISHQMSTCSS